MRAKTEIATTGQGYLELHRNTYGSERTQIMEWLTIAHIDSMKTEVASDGDAYITIPKEVLLSYGIGANRHFTRDIISLHNEMAKLSIITYKGKQVIHSVVFPEVAIDEDSGDVVVKVSGRMAPYMLQLKSNFTQLELPILLGNVSGFWARKLYAICRNALHKDTAKFILELSLEELRGRMGMTKKVYPLYKEFSRNVLKPAFLELGWDLVNSKPYKGTKKLQVADIDLSISAEVLRKGRKTPHAIRIIITPRYMKSQSLGIINEPSAIDDNTRAYLEEISWGRWDYLNNISKDIGSEVLAAAIEAFKERLSKSREKVQNIAGLLHTQLPELIAVANSVAEKKNKGKRESQERMELAQKWMKINPYEKWSSTQVLKAKKALADAGISLSTDPSAPSELQWKEAAGKDAYETWKESNKLDTDPLPFGD